MSAGKVIYTLLSTNSPVTAVVSTRIFPDRASQGAPNPCIIYQDISNAPTDTKDGVSTLDVRRFQIDVYSETRAEAETVNGLIRTALDRQSGTIAGINVDKVIYDSESDFFDDIAQSYRVMSEYRIRVKL